MTADLTREGLAARGLRVKPLEWVVCALPRHDKNKWTAGPYTIRYVEGLFLVYGWNDQFKHTALDLDAAKSAAQADYEARILAALEDTGEPALIREAEARVENAVRGYFGKTIDRHRSLAGVLEAIRGETP